MVDHFLNNAPYWQAMSAVLAFSFVGGVTTGLLAVWFARQTS